MIASRLAGFGTTIFTEMSALAERTGAVNLGQGFPDFDGPAEVLEAAEAAMRAGHNQYAPLAGVPALRDAIAAHQARFYGLEAEDVQVTFGATEAIAAAMLGLLEPGRRGDRLRAAVRLLRGEHRDGRRAAAGGDAAPAGLVVRPGELVAAVTDAHADGAAQHAAQPDRQGVLARRARAGGARVCREHDLIAVADEVYEHLVYEGEHVPLATLDGMAERTLTISSLGKTFSVTGWKIGWATGPAALVGAVRAAKQFLTFAGGTPLQHAGAAALGLGDDFYAALTASFTAKRDRLCAGLLAAGLEPLRPAGTYFVNAQVDGDGVAFCRELPERAGVVAIPTSVFYDHEEVGRSLVRFAFCKRDAVIDEAAARLARARAR